jgi:hypothetical protein
MVLAPCLAMLACAAPTGSGRGKPGQTPSSTREVSQPSDIPEVAAPLGELEVLVGSERGLEAWRVDGSARRLVSAGPALHPRWLSPAALLVLVPRSAQGLGAGASIERIELAGWLRTQVAELPPFACANPAAHADQPPFLLDLQTEDDFRLHGSDQSACLSLMDRNMNMASFVLHVRVDLHTRAVERVLAVGAEECTPPAGVGTSGELARCASAGSSAGALPASAHAPFPFGFGESHAVYSAQEELLLVPGYDVESMSPSGRWLLLAGDESEGDYMHRSLVLLDRSLGTLYPIVSERASWPEPLARADGTTRALVVPIRGTIDVVTETDVRWLGSSESSEVLLIDGLLVKPGVSTFSVSGSVAR